jgi:hypothetical protein
VDSAGSRAEVPEDHRGPEDPNWWQRKPKIDRSGEEIPHGRGGDPPPDARDDDWTEPPSLAESSRRWLVIPVVIIVVLGFLAVVLLLGGQNGSGDENVPLTGFRPQLSYEETAGDYAGAPETGYSVLAVVENIGEDGGSLDDWNVHVELEVGGELLAEEREYLEGRLGSKKTREVPFDLEIEELEPGSEIKLIVTLNDEEDHLYSIRVLRQVVGG